MGSFTFWILAEASCGVRVDEAPHRHGASIHAEERALRHFAPRLVGEALAGDEHRLPTLRPWRLHHHAFAALTRRAHAIVRAPLEQVERSPEAMRIARDAVGEQEIARAKLRARADLTHRSTQ